jgi:hypothetical protein
MASGPSIIATLGADTAPLQRDLAKAEKIVEQSADRMQREQNRAFKKIAGAGGVGHAFDFLKDVGSAFGLGAGLAGTIGLLLPKLSEVSDKAEEAARAMEKLLGPVQAAHYTSVGALQQRLDETNKSLEELARQPGIIESAWKASSKFFESMFTDSSGEGLTGSASASEQSGVLLARRQEIKELMEAMTKQAEMRKDMNDMEAAANKKNADAARQRKEQAIKDEKEFRDNVTKDRDADAEERKQKQREIKEQAIKDEREWRDEVKKSHDQSVAQIRERKKELQEVKAATVAGAIAARQHAFEDEESAFIDDPSAHGEMERRRASRRTDRLKRRFRDRVEHEAHEERRRQESGATRHGPPGILERVDKETDKRVAELNEEARKAVIEINKKLDGIFKSQ